MTQTIAILDEIADIPAGWALAHKEIYPGELLHVPGATFKWYDIRLAELPATPEVSEEAREFIRAEVDAGRLEFRNELGYVLLHLDGSKFFMLVCVWRNQDSLWQGLYFKDQEGFQLYPVKPGLLRATQSVVEMDATTHERNGWSRYLQSAHDAAAKQAYLDDLCTGDLG